MENQNVNVEETLKKIVKKIRPDIDFETEENLISDGLLESLDVVEIVAQVEDELKVVIPTNELTEENFNSLKSLIKLCTKVLGE